MPLRNAVKTEQQMVVARLQMIGRACRQGGDVIRRAAIRRLHDDFHARRDLPRNLLHPHHGGLVTRHGIVRKQRDQNRFIDLLLRELAEGVRDGRMLITHGQFHRHGDTLLQLRPDLAAGNDERRTLRRPDALIGVRGLPGTADENYADNEPAQQPGLVNHPPVHQKLVQITPHVADGGRVRRTEIDQQNAFVHAIKNPNTGNRRPKEARNSDSGFGRRVKPANANSRTIPPAPQCCNRI